jgi:hypothetical protein
MEDSKFGRPRANNVTVTTVAAMEANVQTHDARSAEAARLAREQARYDAIATQQATLARGVIYTVIGVMGLFLLIDVLLYVNGSIASAPRAFTTFAIMYGVYVGQNWARWVLSFLSGLSALLILAFLGTLFKLAPMLGVLSVTIMLGMIGCAVALFLAPAKYHFESQR